MTIDLSTPSRDITMEQGTSIDIAFQLTHLGSPVDMTGFTLRAQVRKSFADTSALINCTLANNKLVWVTQAEGSFKLVLAPADTSTAGNPKITFTKDTDSIEGVYDLEAESGSGVVYKVAKGLFVINREVTR